MKLLFVSQVPDSRLMGVPRVLYSVGDEMQRRGHTVDYFFEDHGPRPIIRQAALMEWAMRTAPVIGRRTRRAGYDAIIATTASGWCLSTFRRVLLPSKTRIVSWHHGFEELMWAQMLEEEQRGGHRFSRKFKLYYNTILWANRKSLQTQDGAFFTSTEERDWIRARYPRQAQKALYLPNGVSPDYYFQERFVASAARHPLRLLFVGYWDPWRKGRKYLVEAFTQLHRQYPDLRLTLAGTKLTGEQILPDFPSETHAAIEVVPHLNEQESVEIYRQHDIFILPALFEGMPLVVLEAMASAMPVVTTANNGMKDLITHYENGLLVPRRDSKALVQAIEHLIEHPELRQKLGEAANDTVQTYYTWRQVTDIFEEGMFRILHRRLENGTC
jgi:glycosyltransferase involved in cell wall biosynthesis